MQKRNYMDIHTHILPGVDDGSSSMEESLQMVDMAYREGIRIIMATPHYGKWNPGYDTNRAVEVFKKLYGHVKRRYPDIKMFFGNEIFYQSSVLDDLRTKKAQTLGGTDYILVEFDYGAEYKKLSKSVNEIVYAGYRPVIAHAERYTELYKDPDRVKELVDEGAYIQINTRSFMGGRFNKRAAWCRELLKSGLVHFVASDCHNTDTRKPLMKTAVEEMEKVAPEAVIENVIRNNIIKLAKNEII